jgi:hypothetical protein
MEAPRRTGALGGYQTGTEVGRGPCWAAAGPGRRQVVGHTGGGGEARGAEKAGRGVALRIYTQECLSQLRILSLTERSPPESSACVVGTPTPAPRAQTGFRGSGVGAGGRAGGDATADSPVCRIERLRALHRSTQDRGPVGDLARCTAPLSPPRNGATLQHLDRSDSSGRL